MTGLTIDQRTAAIIELMDAAHDFAERAQMQETYRDRSRPGTGLHHQHAHSATLWHLAERTLRHRIRELELEPGNLTATPARQSRSGSETGLQDG